MADHLAAIFSGHFAKGPIGVDDSFIREHDNALIKKEKNVSIVDGIGFCDDLFDLLVCWKGHKL